MQFPESVILFKKYYDRKFPKVVFLIMGYFEIRITRIVVDNVPSHFSGFPVQMGTLSIYFQYIHHSFGDHQKALHKIHDFSKEAHYFITYISK